MNEIHEREEQAASEAQIAAAKKTHDDLMRAANLDGVESLADDMVRLIRQLMMQSLRCV